MASQVARMLRVDVPLQHPDVPLLDALDPTSISDRAEVDGEEDDIGEQSRDYLVSNRFGHLPLKEIVTDFCFTVVHLLDAVEGPKEKRFKKIS